MIEAIQEEVKNIVQRSAVSNSSADNLQFPVVQINYFGGTEDCEVISPYGLYYMPPIGSLGVTFNINGESEYKAGIFNVVQQRIKIKNPGECAFANPLYGQQVYFNNQGDVIVKCPGNKTVTIDKDYNVTCTGHMVLKASLITLDADVIITKTLSADGGATTISGGNFNTSGDVVAGTISLKTHVHSGVTVGGSETGEPV